MQMKLHNRFLLRIKNKMIILMNYLQAVFIIIIIIYFNYKNYFYKIEILINKKIYFIK